MRYFLVSTLFVFIVFDDFRFTGTRLAIRIPKIKSLNSFAAKPRISQHKIIIRISMQFIPLCFSVRVLVILGAFRDWLLAFRFQFSFQSRDSLNKKPIVTVAKVEFWADAILTRVCARVTRHGKWNAKRKHKNNSSWARVG